VSKENLGFDVRSTLPVGHKCFYDCDFVNRLVDRRILRAACGRSFLSQQRYEIGELLQNKHKPFFFQRCTSQDNLAACEALGESPSNKLSSIRAGQRQTPNNLFA